MTDDGFEPQEYGPSEQHVLNILSQLPSDSFVRSYVAIASQFSDTHVAHHLVGALSVVAQMVPVDICFPFGASPIYANLFGMLVGSSGSRKTVAVSTARNVLNAADPDGLDAIVGVQPASREALFQEVTECPKKFIAYGEFGDFLATSASKSYLAPLRTAYNDAADAQPLQRIRVRRRNRDGEVEDDGESGVKNPRITVLGAVAQPFLDAHTEPSDWGGGFFARFLTTCYERERHIPLPLDGTRYINHMGAFVRAHYAKWCKVPIMGNGLHYARCGGFTDDARADYVAWVKAMDRPANSSVAVGAATNRLGPLTLKIALLLAWDAMAPRFPFHPADMTDVEGQFRGIRYSYNEEIRNTEWFIPNDIFHVAAQIAQDVHYQSVCQVVGGLAETQQERMVVAVRRALMFADNEQTPRLLNRGELSKELRRDPRDVSTALSTLQERGEVGKVDGNRFYIIGGRYDRVVSIQSEAEKRRVFSRNPSLDPHA